METKQKEITKKNRSEIKEIRNKKSIKKINKTKNCFFMKTQ